MFKRSLKIIIIIFIAISISTCIVSEKESQDNIDLRDYFIPYHTTFVENIWYNRFGFIKSRENKTVYNPGFKKEVLENEYRYYYSDSYYIAARRDDIIENYKIRNDKGEEIGKYRLILLRKPIQDSNSWKTGLIIFNDNATQKDKNKYHNITDAISQINILKTNANIKVDNNLIHNCISVELTTKSLDKFRMIYINDINDRIYYCKGRGEVRRESYKDSILGKRLVYQTNRLQLME